MMLLLLLITFTNFKSADYRFPIQQPLDLSGPGSMLLLEYCSNEKATLRKVFNYVYRSQSRIQAINNITPEEFKKLFKKVSSYNTFFSLRINQVIKNISDINKKFISAKRLKKLHKNDNPMCKCCGKVVCTPASSFYICIDCGCFIKILN